MIFFEVNKEEVEGRESAYKKDAILKEDRAIPEKALSNYINKITIIMIVNIGLKRLKEELSGFMK